MLAEPATAIANMQEKIAELEQDRDMHSRDLKVLKADIKKFDDLKNRLGNEIGRRLPLEPKPISRRAG